MILQPLVENSIFHGLESIEDNGFIHIRTFREGDGLFITIQDNGIGFDEVTLKELEELLSQDIPSDINATFNEAKGSASSISTIRSAYMKGQNMESAF